MNVRKGISFTVTLIVVALVLLATGITVITLGQNSISGFADIFTSNTDDSESDIARQQCNREKSRICSSQPGKHWALSDGSWARDAAHNGRSCRDWAEEEQIYGLRGISSIPTCEEPSQSEKEQICTQAVQQFCTSEDDTEQWTDDTGPTDSQSQWTGTVPDPCYDVRNDIGGVQCGDVS